MIYRELIIAPVFAVLLASSFLTGCIGSSSSSSSNSASELSEQLKPGRYVGEIEFSDGTQSNAVLLLSSTGQVAQISSDGAANFGSISVDNEGNISGELTNLFFDDGWQKANATVEGSTSNQQFFEGQGFIDGQAVSNFSFVRVDALADMSASIEDVTGMYFGSPMGGEIDGGSIALNIESDGSLDGNDGTGCVISGEVTVPSEYFNVYALDFSVANCGDTDDATAEQRNGNYFGLGDLDKEEGEFEAVFGNGVLPGTFVGQK